MSGHHARRVSWGAAGTALVALLVGLTLGSSLADSGFLLLMAVPFSAVGALLAAKRSSNPIGWLLLAFGVVAAVDFLAYQYAERTLVDHPGSLAGDVAASIAAHIWHPAFGFFVFSFLLFPNGRLLSPRWRWVAGATLVVYGGMALSGPFDTEILQEFFDAPVQPLFYGAVAEVGTVVFGALLFANLAMLPLAGASLLVRLRRSTGEERQQVKWFTLTVAFVVFAFPVILFASGTAYGVFLFPLIPASAAVAILKYRLYDIDLVINRTLVYGALTAVLAGSYLACVVVLQLVLRPLTGDDGPAVAVSTLAVASLFRPARACVQSLVDHRFYRRRYDAGQTLHAFTARLRHQVELDVVSADLRAVTHETLQPTYVSVWLR